MSANGERMLVAESVVAADSRATMWTAVNGSWLPHYLTGTGLYPKFPALASSDSGAILAGK